MMKSDFDRLLDRYLNGTVSPDERRKIEAWLESRKTSEERNSVWSPEEEDQLFHRITDSVKKHDQAPMEVPPPRRHFPVAWKIAAGILLIAVAGWSVRYWYASALSDRQELTTLDQPMKVILKDGTIVWLSPASKLIYFNEKKTGLRRAELKGEGVFEVAKDPLHPLVIRCGDVNVKVVGTSFHLKSTERNFELEVFTGKVSVSSAAEPAGTLVTPQEKIKLGKNGLRISKVPLLREEMKHLISRTEYDMQFFNTPMLRVFSRIEKKFDVSLAVGNREMDKCRITADFTDQSLEQTMQMLSELLELNFHITGNSVVVNGKGCN